MKTSLLLFACLATCLGQAQTFEYLDINQVKARVNSGGNFQASVTGKWIGGISNLWIGGLDAGSQLHIAAQSYSASGVDFWPGPLTTISATTNSVTVNQYNRVWKLNKTDIDDFILNYANGNVQNGNFIPAADLLSWPGSGNISQNYDSKLAPFMDVNSDAIYNPLDGDYPIIKGDQAIYTIFNDNYLPHQSSGAPIGAEIHLMAYAYGPCSITTSNSFLNYTTFYNYKIINRGLFVLPTTYAGLFNDLDVGASGDDFVGCDVSDHYGYIYNGTLVANEPAVGVVQLKGPINIENGVDDDADGTVDEAFENMSMTNFMYFNNSFPGIPVEQTDPTNALQYYQYMMSYWRDGTPLTCGGNGYAGSLPTNYAYPNNTFTNSSCGTSSWTETDAGSDKRFLLSSGPYKLYPGAVDELEYAFIASYDSLTNNPLSKLETDVQNLHLIYNTTLNQCLNTGLKEQKNETLYTLSPNPTNGILNIRSEKIINGNLKIEVIDALGKVLVSEYYKEFNQSSLNVNALSLGIYFVKIISDDNTKTIKFIKE